MQDKIIEILRLCLELNPIETRRELTGDNPTVFCNFSGQISACEVIVYKNGWSAEKPEYSYRYFFYTEERGNAYKREWGALSETKCSVDDVIEDLKQLKEA